ncbi:MAG: ABC transporter substrate-binding protein [Pseudobutyrivibrio sp.]|nr:ABC transporter substrate-binding protein [Pseudobutyrivibrio sp.]
MKIKKVLALGLVALMSVATFAGCGDGGKDSAGADGKGKVYYLNFKPEADEAWQEIAKQYTDETGVEVTVITAASGTYEETLQSEIAKDEAPTLFQVNGPVGLANWKDYCYDLKDSSLYNELTSDSFALYDGDAVAGIAYVIESYGIIVNTELLDKAGYSLDDIKGFDDLKKVAEDITARKDELGFAAFTSAGMDGSSDWRFKTHLANLPIYFEYQDKGIDSTDAIEGKYLDNYKNIWDLYINNATCAPGDLAGKTGDDAENEFASGEAVFYQNGSWEYKNLTDKGMTDEQLAMMPIYIGAGDEANQGLCTGTENYWCVNSEASEEDIQATIDFLTWMVTSDAGTKMLADNIGVIPFKKAADTTNLFVLNDRKYTEDGKTPVSWNFTTMPSEEWKNGVGSALTAYAAGTGEWDDVVKAFVDGWASEYAAANN